VLIAALHLAHQFAGLSQYIPMVVGAVALLLAIRESLNDYYQDKFIDKMSTGAGGAADEAGEWSYIGDIGRREDMLRRERARR